MFKFKSSISFLLVLSAGNATAQHHPQTNSLVKMMVEQNTLTGTMNQGTELVLENKMEQANIFFTNEIATDAGSEKAYFNRGVVNWAMSNPENACRDSSSRAWRYCSF